MQPTRPWQVETPRMHDLMGPAGRALQEVHPEEGSRRREPSRRVHQTHCRLRETRSTDAAVRLQVPIGAPEAAPRLRTEQRGKSELRDACDGELNAVLPHAYKGHELEEKHPKAEAIDDEYAHFDETVMHEQDYLSWYGERMGAGIMATAEARGRRRHQPEGPRPGEQ